MSLRTSLQKLIRRDPATSLRERAAELRGSLSRTAAPLVEPTTTDGRAETDAMLLALAPEWEAARNAYEAAFNRQTAIVAAAEKDGRPGRAPEDSGPEWQAWFRQAQEWRERTGVNEAEEASGDACCALGDVEDRIAMLPASSLAGLRLKALVGQRCDGIEIEWPDNLGKGLAQDLLALGADGLAEEAPGGDVELLQLGRQFEAAHTRNIAACEACNAAQREADRHMPERPACLIYRASDARLGVHQYQMMAEALAGQEVRYSDIEWLRHRMPMMHEVLRPIREGERAHRDHPGRKFDIVPHPEAQARAEEIVGAWDAWWTEQTAVCGRYVTEALEEAAEKAGAAVASLAYQIAELPAHTAAGFRVKLRALSHLSRKTLLSEIPDEPDPDQALSHSLWRDVQGESPATNPADTLTAAILDLWSVWAAGPQDDGGSAEEVAAFEALQECRFALIDAAEALPATHEAIVPKALALAWLEYVDQWRSGYGRSSYTIDGRLALDIHAAAAVRTPTETSATAPAAPHEPSLVSMVDFASASLEDLQSLHDIADLVGSVAYATVWTARCKALGPGDEPNAAGKLMQWLGDALTDVETATHNEARRRAPSHPMDRETRLKILALPTIQNGSTDETEALARELLAWVQAEREDR